MHYLALTLSIAIVLTSGAAAAASERSKKDRGEASMTVATMAWQASRASARLANGKLTITAARNYRQGDIRHNETLTLQIVDFKGPGEYVVSPFGSRFVGVGLDVKAATAAGNDDKATTKAATEMLSKAKLLRLSGAKVTVIEASDTEISGTFSWQPVKALKQPEISDGRFRAVLKR